ncbi:sce7725 family protein [Clostridium neuense]|uniref:Sce7725 family protein n=1 Tax=Clostridium neuense TaxID=1728934 RepID=A0ABW8TCJ6_9CLOT
MYLPYLRGRQFELLALRELLEKKLIGNKIIPIIEPIKPTSTLVKTLKLYTVNKRNLAIIMNPKVGKFISDLRKMQEDDKDNNIVKLLSDSMKKENAIKAYIMTGKISQKIKYKEGKNKFIIINYDRDAIDYYLDVYSDVFPMFTLIPDDRIFKRSVGNGKVLFSDRYKKRERNVDYIKEEDEFFSDDHLFFSEEGYKGFSDYSVVGQEFNDSGFAPLAVAIHIVYFDNKKNLRIRHFVSDSNEDIKDPAGKFGEALRKLVLWVDDNNIPLTEALKQFKELYYTGKYPGLGTVKKLSIMHHIELVNKYLEGEI